MEFDTVINGISKFLNAEIYSKMNEWQEMLARIAVSRMIGNVDVLKRNLMNNSAVKMLSIMDDDGNVEIESLLNDIKTHIIQKGKFSISIPLFGKMSFLPEDVDTLRRHIMEG